MTDELEAAMSDHLRAALLALPIEINDLPAAEVAVRSVLTERGIDNESHVAWLDEAIDSWRADTASPDPLVVAVTQAAIVAGLDVNNNAVLTRLTRNFAAILHDLSSTQRLGWHGAAAVLRNVNMITQLATTQHASSGRITRLLADQGSDFPTSWRPVQKLLQHLGLKPSLVAADVIAQSSADSQLYVERFPDSDEVESAETVDRTASRLGIEPGTTAGLLRDLFSVEAAQADAGTLWPYVQMLHYQCLVCEFLDHPPTQVYEFSPRSAVADEVFVYYDSVVATGNPFLNNAKAVDLLDAAWARSATSRHVLDLPRTMALVGLLELLDRLAWSSRRALASWLRTWCHQVIDLSQNPTTLIMGDLDLAGIQKVADCLMVGSTGTKGVIEQRFVDACVAAIHGGGDAILRGLGSAVEEPNLPRRRLGDVDVQDTIARTVVAYEPTAGVLKTSYLRLHQQTLKRSLARRHEIEWSAIDPDPTAWSVTVRFVASSVAGVNTDVAENYGGVEVKFETLTFAELLAEAIGASGLEQLYATWVHDVLNLRRTRRRYREAYIALLP